MSYALLLSLIALPQQMNVDAWQDERSCGVNSLVWCLALIGIPQTRDHVLRLFPSEADETGYSVNDVVHAAHRCHAFPTAAFVSADRAMHLSMPFIAHVSVGRQNAGHFIVVERVVSKNGTTALSVVDGSTGEREHFNLSYFDRIFTGHVIVFDRTKAIAFHALCSAWTLISLLAGFCLLAVRACRHYRRFGPNGLNADGTMTGFRTALTLIAGTVLTLLVPAAGCEAQVFPNSAATTMGDIQSKVLETQDRLLRHAGGFHALVTIVPTDDPVNDFAYDGVLNIETAVLWPKLYMRATGRYRAQKTNMDRVSVYDFVDHVTKFYGDNAAAITPERHMFSSGFAMLFTYMHLGPGYQKYRWGQKNEMLPSIPECFSQHSYDVGEVVDDGGERCITVEAPGLDRILLAIDKGYIVHVREVRYERDLSIREVTRVNAYMELEKNLWIPKSIARIAYFGPDEAEPRRGKVQVATRLDVSEASVGKVAASKFDISFPNGIRIQDLVSNKTWYNNRPFESVVEGSNVGRYALIAVNVVIVFSLIVGVLIWRASKADRRR